MNATATERAVLVSLSLGAQRALLLAGEHPDRVAGSVFIGPGVPPAALPEERRRYPWDEELDTDEGWAKDNRHYYLRDYRGLLEFFFAQMFSEPHSTKPVEDCVGWGLETTAETLIATCLDEIDRARVVRPGSLPGAGDPGHGGRDHRARPRGRAGRGDRR
jgi:pimeloyl-ACP methyl ester carboxylesterase